jgi:hypothetical protein
MKGIVIARELQHGRLIRLRRIAWLLADHLRPHTEAECAGGALHG